jgi:large subunit ribosomal protein L10
MSKAVKQLMVDDLVQALTGVTGIVAGSVLGMTSQDTVKFRAALRAKNVRALMVRNAMCARAFESLGMAQAKAILEGQTVLFYGGESLADTAKVLVEQAKAFKALQVRGGVADGQVLSAADVTALSKLPSREEILGMIVGGLLSPVSGVVSALMSPAQQVASQIEKISERKEEPAAA